MIRKLIKEKILIMDGATGTLIQQYKLQEKDYRPKQLSSFPVPLKGNNDILNLSKPHIIREIHRCYIDAGADIIETNTFNSNAISQEEYHCSNLVYRLNREGATIAKIEASMATRPVFVAGSIGPTSKTLSLSPDALHPEYRSINFSRLTDVYAQQVRGLIDGGVDILLVETIFDGLNAKAALYAIAIVQQEKKTDIPVMISVTIAGKSGRLLTGQSLQAFYTSIAYYPLLSFGLNCSFGATDLYPYMQELSQFLPCYLSIYPNAGLPNETGDYEETPDMMAFYLNEMAKDGLLNIAGGCCGTTPEHIQAIAGILGNSPPRIPPAANANTFLSGLDTLVIDREQKIFIPVGERTNVAGSSKFARLIREEKLEEAAVIARKQIENGAYIIDVNMDEAMLDSAKEMRKFLRYINNDPNIAKTPFMIDSSDWKTLVTGLKHAQGKSIVNSISLKEGEEDFLEKASEIRKLGAAVVVMAFDEEGQAVSYQRKIDICQRAYTLLTEKASYPPQDIIFDVNVLTIGTGLEEHNNYAVDFIKAVQWIKTHLPGCLTSGGVSNLSFAFRGNNTVREAMHSVFLYHAVRAGLDMAIVNPTALPVYSNIEPELLQAVEHVILNTSPQATEQLIGLAEQLKNKHVETKIAKTEEWRTHPLPERLAYALTKGITDYLPEDIAEALSDSAPVAIIEGPLMQGMERVGSLFEEGKMFLPQVVKSARAMREAVLLLQPEMERQTQKKSERPKIVLATVKGDVHDIGKNIVSIVLSCNNMDVIDIGVMIDNAKIVQAAKEHHADFIGVSGLITPSLHEMEALCVLLEKEQLHIPLIVGGATTSAVHTAVKLATQYEHCVVRGSDASKTATLIKRLLQEGNDYIKEVKTEQEQIRKQYHNQNSPILFYSDAQEKAPTFADESYLQPDRFGKQNFLIQDMNLSELLPLIDWTPFFHFWGFKGIYPEIIHANQEAELLYQTARETLDSLVVANELEASLVVNFYDACSEHDAIILNDSYPLPMLRQQRKGETCLSLADFVSPKSTGHYSKVGLFVLKVSDKKQIQDSKDFQHLIRSSLCARLTEAFAQWMHHQCDKGCKMIRPAFGYPACPDHSLKKDVFTMLQAEEKIAVHLTSSCAIDPSTSLCGMLIAHPEARYFGIHAIGREQFIHYCRQRSISEQQGKKWIGYLITD
jgi:5-methyltetrahydrofolate--homocysteine methyltransferase